MLVIVQMDKNNSEKNAETTKSKFIAENARQCSAIAEMDGIRKPVGGMAAKIMYESKPIFNCVEMHKKKLCSLGGAGLRVEQIGAEG